MWEAVFISDLHLNADEPDITARFIAFIDWALKNTHAVYVLGDLFHVWAGDDCAPEISDAIATQFQRLVQQGIALYFMPGNRDFLLGDAYAKKAGFTVLPDPTVINLHGQSVLLSHGDRYCLWDKAHQRFRRITRMSWFIPLFLRIPARWRQRLVMQVRHQSESQRDKIKSPSIWEVVPDALVEDMQKHHVTTLIHGHIHKPGMTTHVHADRAYQQLVLSDWDDLPLFLVYNKTTGFKLTQLMG
jgi:UDP-2,3-diacylglucosamine hydrolase